MTRKLGNAILILPSKLVRKETAMNKEEILAKSRQDHKNEDEREKQIRMRAAIPAFVGMGVIAVTLMLLEMIFLDTVLLSRSLSLVIHGTVATQHWYLAATLKKKVWITSAACFTFCAVLSALQTINAFWEMM